MEIWLVHERSAFNISVAVAMSIFVWSSIQISRYLSTCECRVRFSRQLLRNIKKSQSELLVKLVQEFVGEVWTDLDNYWVCVVRLKNALFGVETAGVISFCPITIPYHHFFDIYCEISRTTHLITSSIARYPKSLDYTIYC